MKLNKLKNIIKFLICLLSFIKLINEFINPLIVDELQFYNSLE